MQIDEKTQNVVMTVKELYDLKGKEHKMSQETKDKFEYIEKLFTSKLDSFSELINEKLDRIETQTKKTNGAVTENAKNIEKNTKWRNKVIGGIGVATFCIGLILAAYAYIFISNNEHINSKIEYLHDQHN